MKRRSFTLIEMMLSLSLFTLIIATFFYWTQRHYQQVHIFEKIKWPLLEERYMKERVEHMLSKATLTAKDEELVQFYSDGKMLLFTFDNGAYNHPLLSNKVRCSLELKENQLQCTLRPLLNKGEIPEISFSLLDKITALSFSFYQPTDPLRMTVDPNDVKSDKPLAGMHTQWKESYSSLPAYIKLIYKRDGEEKEALFDLNYPLTIVKEKS